MKDNVIIDLDGDRQQSVSNLRRINTDEGRFVVTGTNNRGVAIRRQQHGRKSEIAGAQRGQVKHETCLEMAGPDLAGGG